MEYFDMPISNVAILPSKHIIDYSRYFPDLPDGAYIDEWGIGYLPGSVEHFEEMLHPMERLTSPEQIRDFPMPDVLEEYRWEGMNKRVKEIQDKGIAAIYSALQIFEPAWYLRGMENLLMDMMEDEDMAKACLDKMTRVVSEISRKVAGAGVDMIIYGDDVGTQKGMMMSPSLWRKWLKPTMAKAIKAAKDVNPDVISYYHSDGVIYDIIPDLIEIGVDVLNPIQPECMDPMKIKEIYGDRLSFWGTIGTQTTMPFGTPEDVDRQVKLIIETVGKGGGLVIAPTHLLEPEVPWENIEAFVNAVKKYGRYK
jgi:uroporphyrinogen decarboxylase